MTQSIKRAVAESLLERGSLFIHLDPRVTGVAMPAWLRRQPQVVLQVGLNMAIPIPDLAVDDDGIHATLSFNRTPHVCSMPWEAIFALVGDDGRGQVFPESIPPEIRREVDREASGAGLLDESSDDPDAEPEDDATGAPSEGPGADVIPLWPRSLAGTGGKANRPSAGPRAPVSPREGAPKTPTSLRGASRSTTPKVPTTERGDDPPDGPKPRSPHPHLRRIK